MVAVFIQLKSKESFVQLVKETASKVWMMNAQDRCDSCSAQAYVWVKGISGELYFCSHHYNKIMENPKGYQSMMGFMLEIIDERDRLVENRLKDM
jgi:hypothetical protein